jgi:hypothetical protein
MWLRTSCDVMGNAQEKLQNYGTKLIFYCSNIKFKNNLNNGVFPLEQIIHHKAFKFGSKTF